METFMDGWQELASRLGVDLGLDYLQGIWAAAVLSILVLIVSRRARHRRAFRVSWGVHVVLCLGGMLSYELTYPLDAFSFFARVKAADVWPYPIPYLFYGNENFLWLMSWIHERSLFFQGYHGQKIFLSFLSFLGSCLIVSSLPRPKTWWVYGILLFPSIVWWGSIYSKDPIVFLLLSMVLWSERSRGVVLVGACVLLSFFRLWLVPMVVLAILLGDARRLSWKWVGILSALLLGISWYLIHGLELYSVENLLERVNAVTQSWASGGSAQYVSPLHSFWELIWNLPRMAFAALFRPLPWEGFSGPLFVVVSIEGLILLLGFIASFRFGRHLRGPERVALLYIFFWSFCIGLVAYQNLGTAVRFRLQVLPFLLFFIFSRMSRERTTS